MSISKITQSQSLGLIENGEHLDHAFKLLLLAVNDSTSDWILKEITKFLASDQRLLNTEKEIPTEIRRDLIDEIREATKEIKAIATDDRLELIVAALRNQQKQRLAIINSEGEIVSQTEPVYVDQETVIEIDNFLTQNGVLQGLEVCTIDDLESDPFEVTQ